MCRRVCLQVRALLCGSVVGSNSHQQQPALPAADQTARSLRPRHFYRRLSTGASLLHQDLSEHAARLRVRHLVSIIGCYSASG